MFVSDSPPAETSREREEKLNHIDSSKLAVYVGGPSKGSPLARFIDQFANDSVDIFYRQTDLEIHCRRHSIAVLLIVLPPDNDSLAMVNNFDSYAQIIRNLSSLYPLMQFILVTGRDLSLQQSCQVVDNGISAIVDCRKNDFNQQITEHINTAFLHYQELSQNNLQQNNIAHCDGMVGDSTALKKVINQARHAAKVSDAPVIIYGESGTGKQRLAEMMHKLDVKRSEQPFICVNCASITGTLAESELFGHRKGAFTGATEDRQGYFRAASKGTIMLDEIGELSLSLQPKILRVLQESMVMPVGSDKEYRVDVRVIAATHRNLKEMVLKGKFRLDLYQRLNVIQLNVPSLRQRPEDIPELFQSFLNKYAHYGKCKIDSVDSRVYQILAKTVGSGNIRELENIVRQILVFKQFGHRIEISDLPREIIHRMSFADSETQEKTADIPQTIIEALAKGSIKLAEALDDYEKIMLARLMGRGISQTALADRLGVTRRTLYNKLQKYKIRA